MDAWIITLVAGGLSALIFFRAVAGAKFALELQTAAKKPQVETPPEAAAGAPPRRAGAVIDSAKSSP